MFGPELCVGASILLFILLLLAAFGGSAPWGQKKTWNLRVSKGEPFWRGLERGIARSLKKQGWKAKVTKGSGDHGADVVASLGQISFAIEAKWWKADKEIKVSIIKKVVRGMHYHKCTHAAVITTSRADAASKKYAKKAQVLIIEHAFSIHSADIPGLLLNFAKTHKCSDPSRKIVDAMGQIREVKKVRGGQCHGRTRKGTQCKNSSKAGKNFCHLHLN